MTETEKPYKPYCRFVTHARTLDELRAEFVSDIQRRLRSLDTQARLTSNANEASRIARAKIELETIAEFWQEVEIKGGRRGNKA